MMTESMSALGPPPGVYLALRRSSYLVIGSTVDQLRAALDALGPVRAGRRFGAFTDWEVTWRYRHVDDRGARRIADVTVDVSARVTLPRWRPPRSASADLMAAWEALVAAIEAHEQGHVYLAAEAGADVQRRLVALPAFATKELLHEAAASAAQEAVREAREREAVYDTETRHGESQGVRFPGLLTHAGRP